MKLSTGETRNEKGVALPLALIALVVLTGLVVVFLSMSAIEPRIARNQVDMTSARYMAEAGMELAFNGLSTTPDWSMALKGNPPNGENHPDNQIGVAGQLGEWTALTPFGAGLIQQQLPGLPPAAGTYTVVMRNDYVAAPVSDTRLTGETVVDGGGKFTDNNGNLLVVATGTVNGVTRRVMAVIARTPWLAPDSPLACPGVRCAINYTNPTHVHVNGLDHKITDLSCSPPCAATGEAPPKYAITTRPENEAPVEASGIAEMLQELDGKDQCQPPCNPGPTPEGESRAGGKIVRWNGEGARTVAPTTMTQTNIQNFLNKVKTLPTTNLVNPGAGTLAVSNGVGPGIPAGSLGTSSDEPPTPTSTITYKITYITGVSGTHVRFSGTTRGYGLLILDGTDSIMEFQDDFRWNGLVMVVGSKARVRFTGGPPGSLFYGGLLVNDLSSSGPPSIFFSPTPHDSGPDDPNSGRFVGIYASKETEDGVKNAVTLMKIYSWREI